MIPNFSMLLKKPCTRGHVDGNSKQWLQPAPQQLVQLEEGCR